MRCYYVYILTNRSGTLYTGVTNDIERRLIEHREAKGDSFTARYKMDRLVYFEETDDVVGAIQREKQIKGWLRSRKLELIRSLNPDWRDLSEGWFENGPDAGTRSAGDSQPGLDSPDSSFLRMTNKASRTQPDSQPLLSTPDAN